MKKIHAGFASPASGAFHDQVTEEFASTVERLLAENATASRYRPDPRQHGAVFPSHVAARASRPASPPGCPSFLLRMFKDRNHETKQ